MNNYDFFRNPVEAKSLLIDALGIQKFGSSTVYDGEPKACFVSDEDAVFAATYDIDLSTITPIVAKPHFVDNVCPAREAAGIKIDEAFLGSCKTGLDQITVWELLS